MTGSNFQIQFSSVVLTLLFHVVPVWLLISMFIIFLRSFLKEYF